MVVETANNLVFAKQMGDALFPMPGGLLSEIKVAYSTD